MELGAADGPPPPRPAAARRVGDHGGMREQRLVFGEVAELYDRVRAGYPDAAVDDVIGFAGVDGPRLRALEVGAGTGKATVSFAARGLEILALEPSAEMAAVARRNCRPFPRVRIESVTFEEWPAVAGGFGLVFSAQAWHWVRPEVRYRKAAQALRAGGTLALLWNRVRWQGEPLRYDLADLYRRLVPGLYARHPAFPGLTPRPEDGDRGGEMRRTGLFQDETVRTYPWPAAFTADSFIDLLQSQSDHRLLAEDTRARLLHAVREVIAAHGGEIEVPHVTLLVMGHRRG
jgi:SAM-dependent methyltransferase